MTRDLLLREAVIHPGQFIGIDLNERLVERHSAAGLCVLNGDLFGLLPRPEFADVGVLNLDAYYAVDSAKLQADLRLTRPMASRSIEKFGEFCVFLNADLDAAVRHKARASAAMRRHALMVAETYAECGRCQIAADLLLPPDCDAAIDGGELGTFGMFELYRGRKAGHRMANLRLVLS